MNQLVMLYRGGERVRINVGYVDAVRMVKDARKMLWPVVESAMYNGMEVSA